MTGRSSTGERRLGSATSPRPQPPPGRTAQPGDHPAAPDQPDPGGPGAGGNGTRIPLSEWLVALFGLVLVAGSIGFMAYTAIFADDPPPDILVAVEDIARTESGYRVRIRAFNRGGSTGAEVTVEANLKRGGETVETGELTFDYLPPHSERSGGLFFTEDPRTLDLDLRAKGYREP